MNDDRGTVMSVAYMPPHCVVNFQVGEVLRNNYNHHVEAEVGNPDFTVLTPCDCPRHQDSPVFHDANP